MNVAISNTSEKPIYQQLFEQISAQILKGELESGYSLPRSDKLPMSCGSVSSPSRRHGKNSNGAV